MRRFILLLVLALAVAACSSSSDDTTTTSEAVEADTEAGVAGSNLSDVEAMCRTLALYSAARVPPANAAEGMLFVDLEDATSQELAAYGDLLIGAPTEACPEQLRYAEAIQYWLGF